MVLSFPASEDAHIEQVRQAMDKISGVTPLAAAAQHAHAQVVELLRRHGASEKAAKSP